MIAVQPDHDQPITATGDNQPTSCPLCGATTLIDFLGVANVPITVGLLWPTQAEARQSPVGDIQLAYCRHCGFVYNRLFEPEKLVYAPGYEISLHHSPLYRTFMADVAQYLIAQYTLHNQSVIEIGCGKAIFLQLLCQLGANEGFGFDPALEHEGIEMVGEARLTLVRDYYTQHYAHLPHALICCRHVFNQLAQPRNFLTTLRQIIGEQTETVLYFEIPNGEYSFRGQATWNVFYERCSYFTEQTLAQIFAMSGFEVLRVVPCYADDQYLSIEARPSGIRSWDSSQTSTTLPNTLYAYAAHYHQKIIDWQIRLRMMQQANQRVVAWGSGGQGITFLNVLQTQQQVAYVVDINPERQGKFVPGSGQQVVGPEFLQQYRPDVVLITNPTYEHEIKQTVAALGLTCEFIVT
ncbi:class I SAM-dependent methyltransferase [soil metagenome]